MQRAVVGMFSLKPKQAQQLATKEPEAAPQTKEKDAASEQHAQSDAVPLAAAPPDASISGSVSARSLGLSSKQFAFDTVPVAPLATNR